MTSDLVSQARRTHVYMGDMNIGVEEEYVPPQPGITLTIPCIYPRYSIESGIGSYTFLPGEFLPFCASSATDVAVLQRCCDSEHSSRFIFVCDYNVQNMLDMDEVHLVLEEHGCLCSVLCRNEDFTRSVLFGRQRAKVESHPLNDRMIRVRVPLDDAIQSCVPKELNLGMTGLPLSVYPRKYDFRHMMGLLCDVIKTRFGLKLNKNDYFEVSSFIYSISSYKECGKVANMPLLERIKHHVDFIADLESAWCLQCALEGQDTEICDISDVIIEKKAGSHFSNPSQLIHKVLKLRKLSHAFVDDEEPCLDQSWFQGFAWQLVYCANCENHIGWKFTKVGGSELDGEEGHSNVLNSRFSGRGEAFYGVRLAAIEYNEYFD
jgi:hypothetical protein